jgi:hypothetical protein
MRRSRLAITLCLPTLAFGVGPAAHAAGTGCGGFSWPPDAPLKALAETAGEPLAHGSMVTTTGKSFALLLAPAADVMLPATPERPAAFAGWVRVALPGPGSVEVALSADAWVDLIDSSGPLKATAFTGAQDCPGLRKMVRFAATSPQALLLLSAKAPGAIRVVIRPVEP